MHVDNCSLTLTSFMVARVCYYKAGLVSINRPYNKHEHRVKSGIVSIATNMSTHPAG